jgi:hypothetical protein
MPGVGHPWPLLQGGADYTAPESQCLVQLNAGAHLILTETHEACGDRRLLRLFRLNCCYFFFSVTLFR